MVDTHEDYYICCDSCFRSTYGDHRLGIVVKHWNEGKCPVCNDHTPYESFFKEKELLIKRILLTEWAKQPAPDHYTSYELLLQIGYSYYELEHLYVPVHRCVLNMTGTFSTINQVTRPIQIEPENGEDGFRFLSLNKESDHETMIFTTGKRDIILTAMPDYIDIRIKSPEDRPG